MNNNDGKFTQSKKWVAGIVGLGVLYGSMVFSKNGFEFETQLGYAWLGWLLAFAATSAQFMMTSDFRKINWSILLLGVVSYVYSIYTNIQGFHALRSDYGQYDIVNILGSVFMDVYPEVAIAWALGESKLGDLVGNLIQSTQNPQQLTNQGNNSTQRIPMASPQRFQTRPNQQPPTYPTPDIPEFLRKNISQQKNRR